MITGPRGSGKQFVARGIHRQSNRAEKPFVPVDCSQLRGETFTSQLFGHEAGAFGASAGSSLGAMRVADGGILFLGRVDSLPLAEQQQLLDVLLSQKVMPLGSGEAITVDVRVIASSLSDLQKEVQGQCFMPELYTRLERVTLRTVELCHRVEDVASALGGFFESSRKRYRAEGEAFRRFSAQATGGLCLARKHRGAPVGRSSGPCCSLPEKS